MSISFHSHYSNSNNYSRPPSSSKRARLLSSIGIAILILIYYTSRSNSSTPKKDSTAANWSKFAYSQYATDSATLCNAVMLFEALDRLGSKADRVLLYPEQWDLTVSGPKDRDSQLLNLARDEYNVKLHPIQILAVAGSSQPGSFDHPQESWDTSITKLLAFNLTSYDRILHLDNDITLLKPLDELFLLPPTPIAMPRAYWLPDQPHTLTSLLMLLTPSPTELDHLLTTLANERSGSSPSSLPPSTSQTTDMNLLNARFAASALVLPHRPYALLSGELRRHDHTAYLGAPEELETWDADAVRAEAKVVHFSDWPLPKPWIMWPWDGLAEMQPDCIGGSGASRKDRGGTCRERVIWKELYEDFRERRKMVCRLLSVPAPEWRLLKKGIQRAQEESEGVREHDESGKKDQVVREEKNDVEERSDNKEKRGGRR